MSGCIGLRGGRPRRGQGLVTDYSDNLVSVIQTSTDAVSTYIQGFINPINVAAGRDGDKVYVVNNATRGGAAPRTPERADLSGRE